MDCAYNIITANFSGGKTHATTARVYQWSRGIELCITGADNLPQTFKAHFSVQKKGGVATTIVGIDERVTVPNVLFTIGKDIHVWLGASETEDDAEILYTVDIPVAPAPMPEYYDAEDTGVFDAVVEQVSGYAATATAAANSAGASATAAAGSASAAAASASSAAGSAGAAEQARADAVTAKGQAETAAQTATEKALQTSQNASQAALDAGRAESAAERAESAESGAGAAKTAAEAAAQSAAASAATADEKATLAGQSATAAAGSASAAAQSAASIEGDVQIASQKASEAQTAAGHAVTAKDAAVTAQQGAETAATNAGQSASTATAKAAEAAQSASGAAQSKTDAEAAAARAEQAAATLTVDTALSDTSTNPVQNKIITGEITDVKTAIDTLSIDGYTKAEWEDVTANATLHTGAYAEVTARNTFNTVTNSAYKYLEYDITDETKFRTKGFANFGIKPAIFVNANGDVLAYEPPNRNPDQLYTTVVVDVPNGATKLYVDGRNADIISIEKYIGLKFEKEDTDSAVVLTKKDSDIQIRAELTSDTDIAIRGNLYGSPNNTFIWSQYHMTVPHDLSYTNITDGTNWKMSADDITPVHFNYSYRGAGHGDDRTKRIVCAEAHGLTEANIGELWKDGNGNTVIILKVLSMTEFVAARPSDGLSYFKGFESWTPLSPLTKDGQSIAFTSNAAYLLTPTANHVSVDAYVDNIMVAEDGVYNGNFIDIVESYDIIYIPAMIAYLEQNVGNNTNLSICDESIAEAYCTVNNVYHYTEHGACTLFQSVDFHKQVKFEYYGGVQSQPIGNFMNVPKSVSWQTISEQPASDRILAPAEWADADNPPTRFYQYDALNWTKGFVLGINNEIGDAVPAMRKNTNNACTYYRTRKVYPYFKTDENPMAEGTVISAVTYRIPLVPYDDADIPNVAWYYVNNDIYLLIDVQKSVDKYLALPEKMIGRKIEIVESAGSITIPYSFVGAKGIKINTVNYGSAILKLT